MQNGGARTGEILVYDVKYPKRIKNNSMYNNQQGVYTNLQLVVDWVQNRLKYKRIVKEFNLQQCLFGLHQLTNNLKDKAIGIVESEKTAIIASVYMPNLIWMATGGAQNLNARLLKPLTDRKVILFPDVNQFEVWSKKVKYIEKQLVDEYQLTIDITVSDLLEGRATPKMKENGADLADILIKRYSKIELAINGLRHPLMLY